MLSDETLYLTVEELGEQIRSRKISPVELTESYLARLERYGPKLSAVATVTRELALEQARAAEREIAAGKSRGPLHGKSFVITGTLETMGRDDVNQLPVVSGNHLDGIITRANVVQFLHTRAELGR